MTAEYDPKSYWEERLTSQFNLRGTGHISFAPAYNRWLYRAKLRALERVLDRESVRGASVLDVGCGTGFFVDWYLRYGAKVSGVDIAERSISALRGKFQGDFRVLDISADHAALTTTYDIVNVWDVMYHIVAQDGFVRALQLLAGGVKQGGVLLISDQFGAAADVRVAPHVRLRCLETYEDHLSERGFELVQVTPVFAWLNRYVSLPAVDGRLGAVYYWLDGLQRKPRPDNLSLAAWRRTTSS